MRPGSDPLLDAIEAYIAHASVSASAFGVLAVGDPALVYEMRRGRECRRATRARIIDFLEHAMAAGPVSG